MFGVLSKTGPNTPTLLQLSACTLEQDLGGSQPVWFVIEKVHWARTADQVNALTTALHHRGCQSTTNGPVQFGSPPTPSFLPCLFTEAKGFSQHKSELIRDSLFLVSTRTKAGRCDWQRRQ